MIRRRLTFRLFSQISRQSLLLRNEMRYHDQQSMFAEPNTGSARKKQANRKRTASRYGPNAAENYHPS